MKNKNDTANVIKFKGLRFNRPDGDISELVAPPYDVFEYGDQQDKKLRSNPSNISHIHKPLGKGETKYKKAASLLRNFISEKTLIREKENSFYILREEGKNHTRTGITAAVKIDPEYKRIKEHERTKAKPLRDRIKLTLATNTSFGSVFTVAPDRDGKFHDAIEEEYKESNLLYDFISPAGVRSRFYKTQNNIFSELLNNTTLYIADGHHRYKTAIRYSEIMKEKSPPEDKRFDYVMMHIVPRSALTIYPTHRMISNLSKRKVQDILNKLKENFFLEKQDTPQIPEKGRVGLYFNNSFFTIKSTLKEKPDTVFLEEKILKPYFPRDFEINYLSGGKKVVNEVKEKVDRREYAMSFLMAPLSFSDVKKSADKKEMLPPKSTFFYPKIPTGTVIYKYI
ncbi:MAG: DUF1015 family protein [Elusimicrobiota bacterium]